MRNHCVVLIKLHFFIIPLIVTHGANAQENAFNLIQNSLPYLSPPIVDLIKSYYVPYIYQTYNHDEQEITHIAPSPDESALAVWMLNRATDSSALVLIDAAMGRCIQNRPTTKPMMPCDVTWNKTSSMVCASYGLRAFCCNNPAYRESMPRVHADQPADNYFLLSSADQKMAWITQLIYSPEKQLTVLNVIPLLSFPRIDRCSFLKYSHKAILFCAIKRQVCIVNFKKTVQTLYTDAVSAVDFSQKKPILGFSYGHVTLINQDGVQDQIIPGFTDEAIDCLASRSSIIAAIARNRVKILNRETNSCQYEWTHKSHEKIRCFSLSHSLKNCAYGVSNALYLCDLSNGSELKRYIHRRPISSVHFLKNNNLIVVDGSSITCYPSEIE